MAKKALCIGINDYPYHGSEFNGCVNDSLAWAELLVGLPWPNTLIRSSGHWRFRRSPKGVIDSDWLIVERTSLLGQDTLASIMVQAAWSAVRIKNTFLKSRFHSLAAQRGKKRAIVVQ